MWIKESIFQYFIETMSAQGKKDQAIEEVNVKEEKQETNIAPLLTPAIPDMTDATSKFQNDEKKSELDSETVKYAQIAEYLKGSSQMAMLAGKNHINIE